MSYFPQGKDLPSESQPFNWYENGDPIARVVNFIRGRRLMTTMKGYIGLSNSNAQQGDVICILFGCHVPVILRPEEGGSTYSWIGESYVHGIMDGQAMDWLEENPDALKDIVIV